MHEKIIITSVIIAKIQTLTGRTKKSRNSIFGKRVANAKNSAM